MRYQVPQFIEIEDKIFGPLTFKQFVYLAGGGGLCLALATILPLYVAILVGIPVAGFSLALAFYEINGRPFIFAVEHAFNYTVSSKLYLWKQREDRPEAAKKPAAPVSQAALNVPRLSNSRLHDLAWSLNIKDHARLVDEAASTN